MGFLAGDSPHSGHASGKKQTLLFSATMSSDIEKLARTTMKEPKLIEVSPRGQAATMVEQSAYPVAQESKTALLLDLLEREKFERVLVFTRTRRGAERLSHILSARDHSVNRIHSDRTQPQREAALRASAMAAPAYSWRPTLPHAVWTSTLFRTSLISTCHQRLKTTCIALAAPDAQATGRAITIVTPVDEVSMRAIERLTGQTVDRVVLPGFGGTNNGVDRERPATQFATWCRLSSAVFTRSFRPRRASR